VAYTGIIGKNALQVSLIEYFTKICAEGGNSYFNRNLRISNTDINTIIPPITHVSNLVTYFINVYLLFNIVLQFTSRELFVKAFINVRYLISGYTEYKTLINISFWLRLVSWYLIITNTDLYDATSIEYGVSNWLEPLHLIQRLQYSCVFHIHQSEGRDVHRVVLEILQIERLYVLQNQSARSLDTSRPLSVFIAFITTCQRYYCTYSMKCVYTFIYVQSKHNKQYVR
jgi:hypothetical protein